MRCVVVLLVLLFTSAGHAQAPVQDIPPGEDQIEVLMQGKAAPFTGQLFSQDTALRWANWLMQYKARLAADVELERKICSAEVRYRDKLLEIESIRGQSIVKDQKSRILRLEQRNADLQDQMNEPSFWRSLEFGVILGVVGSAAVATAVGLAAAGN